MNIEWLLKRRIGTVPIYEVVRFYPVALFVWLGQVSLTVFVVSYLADTQVAKEVVLFLRIYSLWAVLWSCLIVLFLLYTRVRGKQLAGIVGAFLFVAMSTNAAFPVSNAVFMILVILMYVCFYLDSRWLNQNQNEKSLTLEENRKI